MKRFCHACGTEQALDATFCEECGETLRPPRSAAGAAAQIASAPAPAPSAGAPSARPGRQRRPWTPKTLALVAAAAVLVLGGGGAAWWALASRDATEAELREGLKDWLATDAKKQLNRPCLSNFDYAKSPVYIDAGNQQAVDWLTALTQAELYTGPDPVVQQGLFGARLLRYEKTPKAAQFVSGRQLCAASTLGLESLKFDPKAVLKQEGQRIQPGTARILWADRADWSLVAPFKSEFDGQFSTEERAVRWIAQDQGWRALTQAEQEAAQAKLPRGGDQGHQTDADGVSLWGRLSGLFSGLTGSTPESVAEAAFRAQQDCDPKRFSEYFREPSITQEVMQTQMTMYCAIQARSADKGDKIASLKSTRVGGAGDKVRVRLDVTFASGKTDSQVLIVEKVDGRWWSRLNL
ncbi:zinc ribbon domain-containing protein [Curvibacter sp. HBC28]|uniref:Zinc ribbon domain-containing protein n=1 Tax=Curvibacter microcysteis TaxID=3026419 RepID=A0ABT5MHB7_9BURK|nr:zinc ribbon domain-containing protein [Curvibacter sp. HBC28]MDD0814575.1 zinc ribbon domain-containing protein [Curvibacter sp. HBC28]